MGEWKGERGGPGWEWHCGSKRNCGCPHSSFWKTVVTSPQWKAWCKEVSRRMHEHTVKGHEKYTGCWDVDECACCGWISQEHFQDFMKFSADQTKAQGSAK